MIAFRNLVGFVMEFYFKSLEKYVLFGHGWLFLLSLSVFMHFQTVFCNIPLSVERML